ncbi:MAG: alanine racemase, partial [Psychrobacter sp.]|nr:alanine racemase [Psychrobacter sp.]
MTTSPTAATHFPANHLVDSNSTNNSNATNTTPHISEVNTTSRHVAISINTAALNHNVSEVRRQTRAKVLAMIKANAYGHGVAQCLAALKDADGVGVACFSEARDIRLLGWDKPIVLIEGVFSEEEWQRALSFEMSCVIHHEPQVDWAINQPPDCTEYPSHPSRTVWLKLNSGMNRLGFDAQSIIPVAARLHAAGYKLILTSHFANADEPQNPINQQQIDTFNTVLEQ